MKYEIRTPFVYEASGDSDGEYAGVDHFVLDADGEQMACAPSEEVGLLFAAAPEMLAACKAALVAINNHPFGSDNFGGIERDLKAAIAKAKGGVA
jgi:hypothetical protein